MKTKQWIEKFIKDVVSTNSPEAQEVKGIMLRMIKSEIKWSKDHKHEKVCSRCGRFNS